MKKFIYPLAALIIVAGSAFTAASFQEWKIGTGYSVKFTSGEPSGQFNDLKGTLIFDPADLAHAKFDVSVDASTINTGNGMMNTHAKSAEWFDVQRYPFIRFTSESFEKTASGYVVKGTLDMHGVQKLITIPFTFSNNVFAGSFDVNRLDYNINTAQPKRGATELKIEINVPVTK
jgi:polyisoprenoid-binding protein YceI